MAMYKKDYIIIYHLATTSREIRFHRHHIGYSIQ